jgi:hypothetical protein
MPTGDRNYIPENRKEIHASTYDKVAETIRARADLTHEQIAEMHGVSMWVVGKAARRNGIRRRETDPVKPLVRTGIQINDRQMAARLGVSLEQYLAKKDSQSP